MKQRLPLILPFLLLSVLALLAGLWGGLLRLGWAMPTLPNSLPMQHGPLMISGFLGTLIALERVAALGRRWMYGAPLLSGIGWVASLALPESLAGPLLITLGSLFAAGILAVIVKMETKIYTVTMAVGAFGWLIGNVLWLTGSLIPLVVWWWAAFLVLTITGERLELNRVLRLRSSHYRLFTAAAGLFVIGVALTSAAPEIGARITGLGMLALAAWMVRYDIARRNLRHKAALTRFIAYCLFLGYFWLGLSGVLNLIYGMQYSGPVYDALLHTVFVGFVFSMIFGHAPIILPALTRINVPFRASFYLPLALLHVSLILRVAGDLAFLTGLRKWGGLLNEVAILGFIGLFVFSILRQRVPVKQPLKKTAHS